MKAIALRSKLSCRIRWAEGGDFRLLAIFSWQAGRLLSSSGEMAVL